MIPFCQESSLLRLPAFCKGWVLGLFALCLITALRAASFLFADPMTRWCIPLVATDITPPTNSLIALCHHTVRCTIICLIVPLSCNQGLLGSQGVVLAHFGTSALRTPRASGPFTYMCFPAVQVTIRTLTTYSPHLPAAVWSDNHVVYMSVGSMVPLQPKSWIQMADIWASQLYMGMLPLV